MSLFGYIIFWIFRKWHELILMNMCLNSFLLNWGMVKPPKGLLLFNCPKVIILLYECYQKGQVQVFSTISLQVVNSSCNEEILAEILRNLRIYTTKNSKFVNLERWTFNVWMFMNFLDSTRIKHRRGARGSCKTHA